MYYSTETHPRQIQQNLDFRGGYPWGTRLISSVEMEYAFSTKISSDNKIRIESPEQSKNLKNLNLHKTITKATKTIGTVLKVEKRLLLLSGRQYEVAPSCGFQFFSKRLSFEEP